MSSARKLILAALTLAACSDRSETKPAPAPDQPVVVADAGVADGRAHAINFDPTAGHLDDDPSMTPGRAPAPRKPPRAVEIFLRSTPSGAQVHVDGMDQGATPVLWQGDTGEHEFTFVLKDHALARYRFWVITSGVVHARLEPVTEDADAGVPPPEVVPVVGVPPPPTLVSPDAPPHVMMPTVDASAPGVDAGSPGVSIDASQPGSMGPQP
jgi:hypothetical protein